jgi:hypothetical protein
MSKSGGLGTLLFMQERGNEKRLSEEVKGMSNERTSKYYAYLGPLGQVVCDEVSFFASKDGFPIGTYNSYEEAMESLAWKGRAKLL